MPSSTPTSPPVATRKLSERQRRVVRDRQARQREHLQQGSDTSDADLRPGRVVSNYGKRLIVEDADGRLVDCHFRQNLGAIVCGDRVVWRPEKDATGTVVALEERRSLLVRPQRHGKPRPVAANIDQLLVTSAPVPPLDTRLLDRYLVAARLLDIDAAIIVNKWDLADEALRAELEAKLAVYRDIGYALFHTSTVDGSGLDELREVLRERTSIFVGLSGVGKSSLIDALVPDAELRIGAISAASRQGRHSTTTARLYHLPEGGDLIDSPGVREFGLWEISAAEAARGFVEFHPYREQCRFRDCRHHEEPGCAVRTAVEAGGISPARYQSYLQILADAGD